MVLYIHYKLEAHLPLSALENGSTVYIYIYVHTNVVYVIVNKYFGTIFEPLVHYQSLYCRCDMHVHKVHVHVIKCT